MQFNAAAIAFLMTERGFIPAAAAASSCFRMLSRASAQASYWSFVTPDPAVKGGNGDLPVFTELYNSAGTLWIGILLKDGEYERQCIGREGDQDLGEYGMQVIPVMVAGSINAFAAFFAEIDGNLNGVRPGCSAVRPDKTT